MRNEMIPLQQMEDQYRTLIEQMEQTESAIAGQDLDRVEVCMYGIEQTLAVLAQTSSQWEGLVIAPGEESAWGGLADAMRQAFTRAEQNRAHIQRWIGQTEATLAHMGTGGRAVNGYAASEIPDVPEFLSARG